jgi:hypothetical protein
MLGPMSSVGVLCSGANGTENNTPHSQFLQVNLRCFFALSVTERPLVWCVSLMLVQDTCLLFVEAERGVGYYDDNVYASESWAKTPSKKHEI